ncbi:GNAT family N-acetyltransferase [Candidatus Bipolaricaulota bacterium]|nr:GNAT family N-acetyltransferase [Candidatus Bipolaricaulota bacterium]
MMTIRPAVPSDTTALCQLLDEQNVFHADLLPEFFQVSATQESRIRALLEAQDAQFLVADDGGELVGLIELRIFTTKDLPILVQKRYVYIQEMIVSEAQRGHGIGSALMNAARSWGAKHGAVSLRTSVVPANDRARNFYRSHGFTDIMVSIESVLDATGDGG